MLFKNEKINKVLRHEYFFILLIIGINILIGIFTVEDYGNSYDEPLSWEFGTQALREYVGKGEAVNVNYSHGGGFLIPAKIGALLFSFIFQNWLEPATWHFTYFLVFQLSVFFIYLLARRFVGKGAAIFSSLLYITQPLLWGHSFMNPKDTPFMALLLGSLVLGFNLADNFSNINWTEISIFQSIRKTVAEARKKQNSRKYGIQVIVIGLVLGVTLFVILAKSVIYDMLASLVTSLYLAKPESLLGRLFSVFASNSESLSIEKYITKAIDYYNQAIIQYGFISLLLILTVGFIWLFPQIGNQILSSAKKALKTKSVFPAALLLGMCVSARTFGVAAIVIICFYWLYKNGRNSISLLGWYIFFGAIISIILWPDLWESPIPKYLEYLKNVVGFDSWGGRILFEGELFDGQNYPSHLLPKLIGFQITEPVLLLFGLGLVLSIRKISRKEQDWLLTIIVAGWFIGPVILAIIVHPVFYSGFRHFLFILPPLFIFAGIGFEYLLLKVKGTSWQIILAVTLLLPGLFGIFQLHPYE